MPVCPTTTRRCGAACSSSWAPPTTRSRRHGSDSLLRTAYLHTDFRALTPVDVDLDASAWIESTEGRKLIIRGELRHGDVVCAEAEGLFLKLRDDQGFGRRTT